MEGQEALCLVCRSGRSTVVMGLTTWLLPMLARKGHVTLGGFNTQSSLLERTYCGRHITKFRVRCESTNEQKIKTTPKEAREQNRDVEPTYVLLTTRLSHDQHQLVDSHQDL